MSQTVSEVREEIQSDIAVPQGWEISEGIVDPKNVEEIQNAQVLKTKIGTQFPFIAERVEDYIGGLFESLGILISNAFISISTDATFQILLLVNKDDFFSPRLNAAKIEAEEAFTSIGNVSLQHKFASEGEYYKSYHSRNTEKLRYAFKNPLALAA